MAVKHWAFACENNCPFSVFNRLAMGTVLSGRGQMKSCRDTGRLARKLNEWREGTKLHPMPSSDEQCGVTQIVRIKERARDTK